MSEVTIPDVSGPVAREAKHKLEELSLLILGQHLWSIRVAFPKASPPEACLCQCCDVARESYQFAMGAWPTTEQEHKAMESWGYGKK
jgi:hypothetical protein